MHGALLGASGVYLLVLYGVLFLPGFIAPGLEVVGYVFFGGPLSAGMFLPAVRHICGDSRH